MVTTPFPFKLHILYTNLSTMYMQKGSYVTVTYIFGLVAIFIFLLLFTPLATTPFALEASNVTQRCVSALCMHINCYVIMTYSQFVSHICFLIYFSPTTLPFQADFSPDALHIMYT